MQEAATWLRDNGEDLGSFVITVALLMLEIDRGDGSDLWPWLSNLPKDHDCLLAWSTAERDALVGALCRQRFCSLFYIKS